MVVSRWSENERGPVDALVKVWRETCLIDRKSLLHPDEPGWTPENFAVLMERFVASELVDSRNFVEKLREQLAGVAVSPGRLMAEVIAMHLVFASPGTIGYDKKVKAIMPPLEIIGETLPEEGVLYDALWVGIG